MRRVETCGDNEGGIDLDLIFALKIYKNKLPRRHRSLTFLQLECGAERHLWQSCHHFFIEQYRRAARGVTGPDALALQRGLCEFLLASMGSYRSLLLRLCRSAHVALPLPDFALEDEATGRLADVPALAAVAARLLICIGDLGLQCKW